MLLRWSRPSLSTVGTMNTSTSRDMTQCATDCSRYCRVFEYSPLASGWGWKMRGDTPILSGSGVSLRDRNPRSVCAACRRGIASVQGFDDVLDHLLRIAEDHHG